jgi:Mg2+ and Co2+ transporter CorA
VRNTEAVNRLAMLSLILGAGAVLTGFFGMNFGRGFARLFFEPDSEWLPVHYSAVVLVAVLAFAALFFGTYMVAANWADYRDILRPKRAERRKRPRPANNSGMGRG